MDSMDIYDAYRIFHRVNDGCQSFGPGEVDAALQCFGDANTGLPEFGINTGGYEKEIDALMRHMQKSASRLMH